MSCVARCCVLLGGVLLFSLCVLFVCCFCLSCVCAARYIVDAAISIKSLGVSSTYLIVVGQLMVPAVIGSQDPNDMSAWSE